MCAIRYTNIAEIKIRRYKREKNALLYLRKNTANTMSCAKKMHRYKSEKMNASMKGVRNMVKEDDFIKL